MIIIFDWDGTLCNSIGHIVAAMQDTAEDHGLAVPPAEAVREIVGLGLPEALERLFPGVDETGRGRIAATYSRHFSAPERGSPQLFEGVTETLEELCRQGVELAVATGKSRRGLDRVLGALGMAEFFHATRCADETRSKPHPQMLHEIMRERGKVPAEAIMVGDSVYDLEMARQAGIASVAVSFGVHSRERLAECQPLAIIDQLPALLDLEIRLPGSTSGVVAGSWQGRPVGFHVEPD